MNITTFTRRSALAAAVLVAGGFAASTSAATTDTFKVSINISATCSVTAGTGSDIDFSTVPSDTAIGDASLTKSSNIQVTCSNTTPYIVGLSPASNAGGTDGTGTMAPTGTDNSTDPGVPYKLTQDSAGQTPWGNSGTAPTSPGNDYAGIGTGSAQTIPVYATVTDPNHMPGPYSDTVTVQVQF